MSDELSPAYNRVIASLPAYLQPFCIGQNYAAYTAEQQATWRYILRRHQTFLAEHAHCAYRAGLKAAAIDAERIVDIDEMNARLGDLGWRAVVVDGFVPPAIFMEFQSHRILPISADMRTLDHINYTPAPDIVHEAAGHAPILADRRYGDFLARIGEVGARALARREDQVVYEAIRALSIVKEHPNSTHAEIEVQEKALTQALVEQSAAPVSEAAQVARLHWWTVEYGLVGPMTSPRLFGAGLLSSLLEARSCSGDDVEKRPLSLDCLGMPYDITSMQPGLYVARDFDQLFEVLDALAETLAWRLGGVAGVERAIDYGTLATAELSSGLQISGFFSRVRRRDADCVYLHTSGPTSLAYAGSELPGHDVVRHPAGFGSPVGRLAGGGVLEHMSVEEMGLELGERGFLEFASGVRVAGVLERALQREGKTILLTLQGCRVTASDGEVLFDPEWGSFDMAVGEEVVSVFAGPADRNHYGFEPPATSLKNRAIKYTPTQIHAEDLYRQIREMRVSGSFDVTLLRGIYEHLHHLVGDKWLMLLEIYELLVSNEHGCEEFAAGVRRELDELREVSTEKALLIDGGLELLKGKFCSN
jgi:phenylalanine-4-hydroxylase